MSLNEIWPFRKKQEPKKPESWDHDQSGHAYDVANSLKSARAAVEKRIGVKLEDLKKIGKGMRGVAYHVKPGLILKVTTDKNEARAALHLKKSPSEVAVKIYDVFKLPGGNFGILMEELFPLSDQEKNDLNWVINILRRSTADSHLFDDDNTELLKVVNQFLNKEEEKHRFADAWKKFDLRKMRKALIDNSITANDIHAGNIMKRGDAYVIIDLGADTVAPGSADAAPTLESAMIRVTVKQLRNIINEEVKFFLRKKIDI